MIKKIYIPNGYGKILKSCKSCRISKIKCDASVTSPYSCTSCFKKNLNCSLELITKKHNDSNTEIIKKLKLEIIQLKKKVNYLFNDIESTIPLKEIDLPLISCNNPYLYCDANKLVKKFELSLEDTSILVKNYKQNFHPFLPIFPNEFFQVVHKHPLLFWCIILVSLQNNPVANSAAKFKNLLLHIEHLVINHVWLNTPRSIHTILALLILTTWPLPNNNVRTNNNLSIKFIGIIKSLILQFGLHRLEFIHEFSRGTDLDNVIRERIYKFGLINLNFWLISLGLVNMNDGLMTGYTTLKESKSEMAIQERNDVSKSSPESVSDSSNLSLNRNLQTSFEERSGKSDEKISDIVNSGPISRSNMVNSSSIPISRSNTGDFNSRNVVLENSSCTTSNVVVFSETPITSKRSLDETESSSKRLKLATNNFSHSYDFSDSSELYINSLLKISTIQSKLNENMNDYISNTTVTLLPKQINTSEMININMFEIILDDLNFNQSPLIQFQIEFSKLQTYIFALSPHLLSIDEYKAFIKKILVSCFNILHHLQNLNFQTLPIQYKFPLELVAMILIRIFKSPILNSVKDYQIIKSKFNTLIGMFNTDDWKIVHIKLLTILSKFDKIHNAFILNKSNSFFLINKMKNYLVSSLNYELIWLIFENERDNKMDNLPDFDIKEFGANDEVISYMIKNESIFDQDIEVVF